MVEDDPEFAADMQAVLAGIVRLDRVPNTAMAAAWLIRRPPDLLWLDLDLPPFFALTGGFEGLAFLRLVRERLAPELPVIVVSGRLTPEVRRELHGLEPLTCFGKPPELGALVRALTATSRVRAQGLRDERRNSREGLG